MKRLAKLTNGGAMTDSRARPARAWVGSGRCESSRERQQDASAGLWPQRSAVRRGERVGAPFVAVIADCDAEARVTRRVERFAPGSGRGRTRASRGS